MEDISGLSNSELKELILGRLGELGVEHELIIIEIKEGPKVILRGEVYTEGDRKMVVQSIIDDLGVDDVVDELIVLQEDYEDLEGKGEEEQEEDIYEQGEEYVGTEDVFRSIEDGIPYIPPTSPTYQESPETVKWKKKKKEQ
ncbi:hypothetical protein ACFL5E_01615 [Candidatus Omnitrophota bacterium]